VPGARNSGHDVAPPGFIAVARVRRPFGLRGEVRCDSLTDFPDRFKRGLTLTAGERELVVRSVRVHQDDLLLAFSDIETPEAAEALRGALLCVPEDQAVKLPAGSYFVHDLIGLRVSTAAGEDLGEVLEILATGSNDVWLIRGPRGEVLLPALDDVILEVDVAEGRAVVEVPPGLIDEAL
jgi:16S rRNA processing protein RimM